VQRYGERAHGIALQFHHEPAERSDGDQVEGSAQQRLLNRPYASQILGSGEHDKHAQRDVEGSKKDIHP
ncbi:hypothetical protein, partial [Pseudomonas sp. 10B1]|uniref:hypothetical protein n=1 Tax=Pseudomonas sp. 10B1 TaxID=3048573 RepID=UPI002B225C6C